MHVSPRVKHHCSLIVSICLCLLRCYGTVLLSVSLRVSVGGGGYMSYEEEDTCVVLWNCCALRLASSFCVCVYMCVYVFVERERVCVCVGVGVWVCMLVFVCVPAYGLVCM